MTEANCTIDQPKTEANYDAIPNELRRIPSWLNHLDKKPVDGRGNLVPNWQERLPGPFADAAKRDFGLGIYLAATEYLVGIDLDDIGGKTPQELADDICDSIGGYQETSPSGNGKHIIVRVTPETFEQLASFTSPFEFYVGERYFTVTGNALSFDSLDGHDDEVLAIFEKYRPEEKEIRPRDFVLSWSDLLSDDLHDEVIDAASQDVCNVVAGAVEGSGGSGQFMGALRFLHDGWGLTSPADLLAAVEDYNANKCSPPFDLTDLSGTGPDSGLKKINDVITSDWPIKDEPLSRLKQWNKSQSDLAQAAIDDWLKFGSPEPQSDKVSITFGGRPLAELAGAADEPVDWLVDGVLSADQPTIFGARKKSLKTTWLLDLAIALDVGGRWLDHWSIPRRRKVLFITGESNYRATARRARRALQARGLSFAETTLSVEAARFPKFNQTDGKDLLGMRRTIEDGGYDVVIVDPLFRGMSGGTNSANLFEMGDALGGFMAACAPASVIISHHVKKSASHSRDIPELDDLSQSGVSEFAGNYVLFGRMGDYAGDGKHEMALMYGGRDEQYGQYHVDFDEFAWTASVEDWSRYADRRTVQRELRQQQRHDGKARAVLEALDATDDGELSLNKIASATGSRKGSKVLTSAIESLQASGDIVPVSMTRGSQTFEGFRRCYPDDSASV